MLTNELDKILNSSKLVICRSGYSSVLDLVSLNKKALLIPTKFQNEQEYLAKHLHKKKYFSYVKEKEVNNKIVDVLPKTTPVNLKKKEFNSRLFDLFHGK
jgi:UDP-N-acetylglucosamine:LPS N-acetylglucosamine transferase